MPLYLRIPLEGRRNSTVRCFLIGSRPALIVAGNFLTIGVFAKEKKLRKKSLFLVVNMAFADFILIFGYLDHVSAMEKGNLQNLQNVGNRLRRR